MSRVLFFGERLMAVTVDLSGNRLGRIGKPRKQQNHAIRRPSATEDADAILDLRHLLIGVLVLHNHRIPEPRAIGGTPRLSDIQIGIATMGRIKVAQADLTRTLFDGCLTLNSYGHCGFAENRCLSR